MKRCEGLGYSRCCVALLFLVAGAALLTGCPWRTDPLGNQEGEGEALVQEGEGTAEGEAILPLEGEAESLGPEGLIEGTPEGEPTVPLEGEGEWPEPEGQEVLPFEGEAEVLEPEGAAEGSPEGEGAVPLEGEGEWLEPEGVAEGFFGGEAPFEGEELPPDALPLCEYWPLVTGNSWEDNSMIDASLRLQVDDTIVRNGYEVFVVSCISSGWTTQIHEEYWLFLDGWLYVTEDPADLDLLPSVGPGMERFLPEWLIPGESFVSAWTGDDVVWTPSVDEVDIDLALEQLHIPPEARPVDDIVVLELSGEIDGELRTARFPLGRYYGPLMFSGLGAITQSQILYSTECSGLGEVE